MTMTTFLGGNAPPSYHVGRHPFQSNKTFKALTLFQFDSVYL